MGYVDRTLASTERVILRAALHWIIFTRAALLALAAVLVGAVWLRLRALGGDASVVRNVAGCLALVASAVGISALASLKTTEIAVTTRRFTVKRGLVRRTIMEIHAGQIESVEIAQSLWGRLLGYGSVTVAGTGSGLDPVGPVVAPIALRNAINGIGSIDAGHPASTAPPQAYGEIAVLVGDGQFGFPVVGELHHQAALEDLAGPRSAGGAESYQAALLVPQPDNPYDPDAVAVLIRGREVGYLAGNVNGEFLASLHRAGFERAACEAVIVGGWDRGEADRGWYGVRLNARRPFRFQTAEEWGARKRGR